MTDLGIDPAHRARGMHPFVAKIISKLARVRECFEDDQAVDIGTHWLDLLTRLGLLNRLQHSPALWEITQQGLDALSAAKPLPAVDHLQVLEGVASLALEAYRHWDADRDVKVGKILAALSGGNPGYDSRADAFRQALDAARAIGHLPCA